MDIIYKEILVEFNKLFSNPNKYITDIENEIEFREKFFTKRTNWNSYKEIPQAYILYPSFSSHTVLIKNEIIPTKKNIWDTNNCHDIAVALLIEDDEEDEIVYDRS
jgi:hypothetical protein